MLIRYPRRVMGNNKNKYEEANSERNNPKFKKLPFCQKIIVTYIKLLYTMVQRGYKCV